MMKIELTDIKDWTKQAYLKQNPDFANQLVATLNQVDGYNCNDWWFAADSCYWTYDYWISPHYEIDQDSFVIHNDQITIRSTNRDDLLNVSYYQELNDLANKDPFKEHIWTYFVQDRVLCFVYWDLYLNIKLTKPIEQYDQKQINAIGKFMINVYDLIVKDDQLDRKQVDKQWKQRFDNLDEHGIVFDLNDFDNPRILMKWGNQCEKYLLKQILNDDSPLLKFLNESDFKTHLQPYQSKAHKFFKRFLDA